MSEIINIFLYEELIKRREKIPLLGWNKQYPTKLNQFTIENGTIKTSVLGGNQPPDRILVL